MVAYDREVVVVEKSGRSKETKQGSIREETISRSYPELVCSSLLGSYCFFRKNIYMSLKHFTNTLDHW